MRDIAFRLGSLARRRSSSPDRVGSSRRSAGCCKDQGVRHVYECPLRWADLDLLGHVNNVSYVDFLQEARIDMLDGLRAIRHAHNEGIVVVRHEVEFAAPMLFRDGPVSVECWVTEIRAGAFTIAYEIVSEHPERGRVVYCRAKSQLVGFSFETDLPRRVRPDEREFLSTYLDPSTDLRPESPWLRHTTDPTRHVYDVQVRWSDIDSYKHVNNVAYFVYFQEARIKYLQSLHRTGDRWTHNVIARTDVDYVRQMTYRRAPYAVHSWLSHIGTNSWSIDAEIRDGDDVLARSRSVLVTFDAETQQVAPMHESQRQAMTAELPTS